MSIIIGVLPSLESPSIARFESSPDPVRTAWWGVQSARYWIHLDAPVALDLNRGSSATPVFAVALLALVVVAIVWLVRNMTAQPRTGGQSPARAELDRRYAAGELSRDGYLERRRDIDT